MKDIPCVMAFARTVRMHRQARQQPTATRLTSRQAHGSFRAAIAAANASSHAEPTIPSFARSRAGCRLTLPYPADANLAWLNERGE